MNGQKIQPASDFKGPPDYPHLYPGQRPPGSYVLSHNDEGVPIVFSLFDVDLKKLGSAQVNGDGKDVSLNDFRAQRRKKPVEDLIPTYAYGSNVNPMQLAKRKFGMLTDSEGLPDIDIVALKGWTKNYDVAYMSRSAPYGSVGAKIIPSKGTESEGWLLLLNSVQLMRMHDTEGVRKGVYKVGIQDFMHTETRVIIPSYGYFGGTAKIYVEDSNGIKAPIRFAGSRYRGQDKNLKETDFVPIDSKNAKFPEKAEIEMMKLYNRLVKDSLGFPLFEWTTLPNDDKVYRHTKEGKENLDKVNKFLADYGEYFSVDSEFITEPYDKSSFKTLKDII